MHNTNKHTQVCPSFAKYLLCFLFWCLNRCRTDSPLISTLCFHGSTMVA